MTSGDDMQEQGDRVAIVTGAASGIGAATALRLAADGMAVAVLDIAEEGAGKIAHEIQAKGGTAIAIRTDVSVQCEVDQAVERVTAKLGAPSTLVNNAGILRNRPFSELTVEDWDAVINVNLRSAFLTSKALYPYMRELGWGRIVNVSSMAANGERNQANYGAAKAGLQALTKTLAIELGAEGITVNAVAPGYIVTGMTAASAAGWGLPFEKVQEIMAGQIPVRRVGKPEDIAHIIAFLVSDDASFITGEVIYATGGPKSGG
jgi:3-oxoacyl-[acyl-carrier protein] reductase